MINHSPKGFTTPFLIAIIALVAVVAGGVGYFVAQKQPQTPPPPAHTPEAATTLPDTTIAKTDKTIYVGTVLAGRPAPLLDFTKADYDAAVKSDKLIVLYFYANWCPTCKAEFPITRGAFDELTTDKAIGFRVNYNDDQTDDDEKNLAREFGVAYQHTKVFVKNGKRILKSPETWGDKRYDIEIDRALGE